MATPTTPASTSAASATQGTIVFVQGEAYLRDRQGKLQAIKPGDAVAEGQEIVTTAGTVVDVQLPSGAKLSVGPDRQVLLNDELFATAAPEPSENVVSSLGAEADKVIQALNTGGDPFAGIEDPAAGLAGGGNSDQTHDFVRLVRILEDVTPLAFSYTSSSDGIDFLPVSSITALPTATVANRPPVAVDYPAFTVREDEPATVAVLTNDSDPDQDPISVTNASAPNGTVTLNPDGTLRYVPNPNFNGTDTITYTISDGKGGTATATVTVNVTPVNDAPTANDSTAKGPEDAASIPVTLSGSDPDGSVDHFTLTGLPTNGTLYLDAAHTQPVLPGMPLPAGAGGTTTLYFVPAANWNGKTDFPYTATDADGLSSPSATVSIEVTPVNDAPTANDSTAKGPEDAASIPVTLSGSDPDGSVDHFTLTGLPTNGTLYLDAAHTQPVLPGMPLPADAGGTTTLYFVPAANWNGKTDFPYTATDADGLSSPSATVSIEVTPVNDAPTANNDSGAVGEGGTLTVPFFYGLIASGLAESGKDTDPDGDKLTVIGIRTGGQTDGTGTPGRVGTPLVGVHGELTVNPDGSYTYKATDSSLAAGQKVTDTFTYTISDGQGGTDTAKLVINITGANDAPVVVATTANISEEGLAGGEPDTLGTIDTTNDASHGGTISISDLDGGTLSVTLSAPATSLSSAGVPITWSGSGTQTLVGSANGVKILTATIDDKGNYTVTLSGPIDHPATTGEDALNLNFGVNVSDGTNTTRSTLTITVEDDAPQAVQINQTIEVTPTDTNLLLILDISGSMEVNKDGVGGTSRLATAISALNQLLDSYDNSGEVRVRLVTFNHASSAQGSGWMAASDAKALLSTLTSSGATNYDAALATAQSAFGSAGKLASGQNIAYFLSDGSPSIPSWSISPSEEVSWQSFLATNQITSFALGMGANADQEPLNPIAYNGITNTNLDGQVITDFNKLAGALLTTIPPTASGEILSGSLHGTGFGGDGGHVSSITVDGVTYAPDTNVGALTVTGGPSAATYDAATNQVRVLTATGGALVLDFDTGSYTYTTLSKLGTSVVNDGFAYVLVDNDGDSAGSEVLFAAHRAVASTITLSSPQQVTGTGGNDSITGSSGNDTIFGGAGNDIIKGGDGADLIAGGAGHDTLSGGDGADTFKWSLGDAGTTAAPAVDAITDFNTASASTGGDVLDLRDLLQGESHTGNLAGNLGSYLHFEKIGADTVVNISSSGGFSSGNYSATDQKLVLQAVDLTTLGSDTQIIQNLLANGKLNTD